MLEKVPVRDGLNDAEIRSLRLEAGKLEVEMINWKQERIVAVFEGVSAVSECASIGRTLDVLYVRGSSEFLDGIRGRLRELDGDEAELMRGRHYSFMSVDGDSALDVVAEDVSWS